jgi:hypothetical protein
VALALSVLIFAAPAQAAGMVDQEQTTVDGELGIFQSLWMGQTFTAGISGKLDQVDLAARQNAGLGLPLIVQIRTVSGGLPSGTVLSTTTATVVNTTFTALISIPLSTPVNVVSGTQYAIVAGSSIPEPPGGNALTVGAAASDAYAGGDAALSGDGGASWALFGGGGNDLAFRTYVSPHTAADCKDGGWRAIGDFRNQGDCVKSFR